MVKNLLDSVIVAVKDVSVRDLNEKRISRAH